MEFDIFIDFDENENALLIANLPLELIEVNEELYSELCYKPIYIEKGLKLESKKVQNKINELIEIIKVNFTNSELFDNVFNISYKIHDEYKNKKTIIKFLKQNKDFKITLEATEYKYLINKFSENDFTNLNIIFKNNYDSIPFKKFYNMYKFLDEITSFIKHYNLSPLEQVMLIYDIVKSHEYVKENKDESISISRSLSEIISSGKIVCDGFANLFNFILDELGIVNKKVYLSYTNKNSRHARNLVYIKDKKYNINNFFITDVTFDCKKPNKNYLDNYYYFLKPLNFFSSKDEIIDNPNVLNILKLSEEEIEEKLKVLNHNDKLKILLKLNSLFSNKTNNASLFFAEEKVINEELRKKIKSSKKLINKQIPEVTFKNALYKIRKIEFINNIIKTEPTEEKINNVCKLFYTETAIVKALKAFDLYEEPSLETDLKEANAQSTEEDLLRMRLLKAIKIKLQNLPENQIIKRM